MNAALTESAWEITLRQHYGLEGLEPKSLGMKAILPHVDDFHPVHNLESLAGLTEAPGRPGPRREEGVTRWLETMR